MTGVAGPAQHAAPGRRGQGWQFLGLVSVTSLTYVFTIWAVLYLAMAGLPVSHINVETFGAIPITGDFRHQNLVAGARMAGIAAALAGVLIVLLRGRTKALRHQILRWGAAGWFAIVAVSPWVIHLAGLVLFR